MVCVMNAFAKNHATVRRKNLNRLHPAGNDVTCHATDHMLSRVLSVRVPARCMARATVGLVYVCILW